MADLIARAVDIAINGGDENAVWNCLHSEYSKFGDPVDVHVAVLDGADAKIKEIYPPCTS